MPPKIRKLTSKEMLEEIKRNTRLAQQSLMHNGMPKSTIKINEHTLFRVAVENGHKEIVKLMIQKGCSITGDSTKPHYGTPLHVAIEKQNIEIVRILLQSGALLEATRNYGQTPLHYAVKSKQKDIMLLLLQHGANWKAVDNQGRTILHLAVENNVGRPNVNSGTPQEIIEILKVCLSKGMSVDSKTKDGQTPLHFAIKREMKELVEFFLLHNANLLACDKEGNLVLHILIAANNSTRYSYYGYSNANAADMLEQKQKEKRKAEFIDWLISKGADIDFQNSCGKTPLHIAAKFNQKQILKILLQHSANLNACDKDNNTALHIFLQENLIKNSGEIEETIAVLKIFLEKGSTVDNLNNAGETPIHIAAKNNQKKFVQILLQNSTNLNITDKQNGNTFLHKLLEMNAKNNADEIKETAETIKMLLEKGASVDCLNRNLETPIHIAAKNNQKKLVQILLQYSTNLNIADKQNGNTVLHKLLEMNAKINADKIKEIAETIKMLLEKGASVDCLNRSEEAPIHIAAKNKQKEIVTILLPHFTKINSCDSNGNTLLHTVIDACTIADGQHENDYIEIVRILISKGAKVNARNKDSSTALQFAAKNQCKQISELLLQNGADVQVRDDDGKTILHFLSLVPSSNVSSDETSAIDKELVGMFSNLGCDVNATTNIGTTALHLSCQSGRKAVVEALLAHGADLHLADTDDLSTSLHVAAENNQLDIVELLLKAGADANARRKDGQSSLHLAARHLGGKLTRMLLSRGADVGLCDRKTGKTPLHYACWYENLECIEGLLEYGADANAEDDYDHVPLVYFGSNVPQVIRHHLVKLNVADFPLAEENEDDTSLNGDFYNRCLEEVGRLKGTRMDNRVTLYDVMRMSDDELAEYKNNAAFKGILYGINLKRKYPLYRYLILACYRKGIARSGLIETAKQVLRQLIREVVKELPDSCVAKIFGYLSNEDLRELIKADQVVSMVKRKVKSSQDVVSPAKRQRTE